MPQILNLELMRNPFNWIVLYLMVMIVSLAVMYLTAVATASLSEEN